MTSVDHSILDFLKTFGINTKTNFDLKDYANYLNLKIKILMNDELYKIKNASNIIINYQDSDEKGSHWVCIYKNLTSKGGPGADAIYFDSFGIKPTKEVEDYLNGREGIGEGKHYTFNSLQVQPWNTKICGVLCLYVLYRLSKGEGKGKQGRGQAHEGEGHVRGFKDIIQEIYNDLKSLL